MEGSSYNRSDSSATDRALPNVLNSGSFIKFSNSMQLQECKQKYVNGAAVVVPSLVCAARTFITPTKMSLTASHVETTHHPIPQSALLKRHSSSF